MRAISLCTAFMSSPMKFISLCSTKKLDLLVIVGRISKGISTRNINFLVFVRKFPELCSTWKQNIFLSSERQLILPRTKKANNEILVEMLPPKPSTNTIKQLPFVGSCRESYRQSKQTTPETNYPRGRFPKKGQSQLSSLFSTISSHCPEFPESC